MSNGASEVVLSNALIIQRGACLKIHQSPEDEDQPPAMVISTSAITQTMTWMQPLWLLQLLTLPTRWVSLRMITMSNGASEVILFNALNIQRGGCLKIRQSPEDEGQPPAMAIPTSDITQTTGKDKDKPTATVIPTSDVTQTGEDEVQPTVMVNPTSDITHTMGESLQIVMSWQGAEVPSRFAIGGGDLRKIMIRVHQQPINFLIVVHQSVQTAKAGQSQCKVGIKAVMALLGEGLESHSDTHKKQFTTVTLQKIRESTSDLDRHTNDILGKFRLLRVALVEVHSDLDNIINKREQGFLGPLSRKLSKDVRKSESALRRVLEKLEEVENSLNLLVKWWQGIEAGVEYLQTLGDSPTLDAKNTITLRDIKNGFFVLEGYFSAYRDTMRQLYDKNVTRLNDYDKQYLTEVKDCSNFVLSKLGRLQPPEPIRS